MIYTDDSILAGPHKYEVEQVIQDIKNVNLDIKLKKIFGIS